ncbi:MAG: site-2 protease family protein [Actinomycetales bacterium]|nr:site-2 protease family protein [Actinomycetales bacterium]
MASDRTSGEYPSGMRIGSFLGVPVYIGWTWLLLAAFITWSSGSTYLRIDPELGTTAYVVGAVVALGLLLSVLVHEGAHAMSARAFGMKVRRIVADLMGGHTAFEGRSTPWSQGVTGLSGPLANLLLAGVLYAVASVVGDGLAGAVLGRLAFINLLLAVFNLLPGLPLDGGQVLMAAVWRLTGSPHTASVVAGWSGRVVAVLTVAVFVGLPLAMGATPGLLILVFAMLISGFLWTGASQSIAIGRARQRISTTPLEQIMRPAVLVPAGAPIATWWAGDHQVYVTVDPRDGHPNGIVRADAVASVPLPMRASVPASAVSVAAPPHWVYEFDGRPTVEQVFGVMAQGRQDVLLVVANGQVQGIVFGADAMRLVK